MRIVAGTARGRRLLAPAGRSIRPTSDRVREAVFNMVASRLDLDGAHVIDLFAGTGAMGIEALSRGAAHATFVDRNRAAVDTIRANLAAIGLDRATVVRADVLAWLPEAAPAAGVALALIDPPYAFDGWDRLFTLLRAGLVVAESDRQIEPGEGWRVLRWKRHGSTVVTLATPAGEPSVTAVTATPKGST